SDAATTFPLGGTFAHNADNAVHLRFDRIESNVIFPDLPIPYIQERSVDVWNGAEVAFVSGVDYRFAAGAGLDVGWNSSLASIQVGGSAEHPVLFRGATPMRGFWRGITIEKNVRSTSRIAGAKILYAGGGDAPALDVRAAMTLRDVSLEENNVGVFIKA